MFNGGMVFVTLPAGIFGIGLCRFRAFIEVEIGPLVRKAGFVLHFDAVPHEIGLKVSDFVDRTLGLRTPFLDDKHGLVGPLPALDKFGVGPLWYKNVGEHHVVHASGAIAHAESGREEYPFAEVLGWEQLIVSCVLRLAGIGLRSRSLHES